MLQPADIYVLTGLVTTDDRPWTYRQLASDLHLPHALVQRALGRSKEADLYSSADRRVHRANLEEFLLHGLRFVVPARLGAVVAGVPAAWATAPMARLVHESGDLVPVWPSAHGTTRGQTLHPLHRSAVVATAGWAELSELLAIVDSIRAGDLRIRTVAEKELVKRLRAVPAQP